MKPWPAWHLPWAPQALARLLLAHGVPAGCCGDVVKTLPALPSLPPVQPFPETVWLGGLPWQAVPAPGHAGGQRALFQPERRLLIAGDHLLEHAVAPLDCRTTANRPVLAEYLRSLAQLGRLEVDLVLPSHGAPYSGLKSRIGAVVAHHEKRLDQVKAACAVRPDLAPSIRCECGIMIENRTGKEAYRARKS